MLTRRRVLFGGAGLTVGAAVLWLSQSAASEEISAAQAHQRALSGELLLIDLRRPEEWAATGIGEGAVPLDMRREDFLAALAQLRRDDRQPVALICARGVRSRRMTLRLRRAGIGPIIDVPEGMLGSIAGPGWLQNGLPVRPWTG